MIDTAQIDEVASYLEASWQGEASLGPLRGRLPGVHIAWCLEDEVGADEPLRESGQFNLYLIDGSSHCMTLTRDPAQATGILIAEVDE